MGLLHRFHRARHIMLNGEQHDDFGCPYMDKAAEERLTEQTAQRTVELLESKIYLRIGRGVVHKTLYLIGMSAIAVAAWLHSKDIL